MPLGQCMKSSSASGSGRKTKVPGRVNANKKEEEEEDFWQSVLSLQNSAYVLGEPKGNKCG